MSNERLLTFLWLVVVLLGFPVACYCLVESSEPLLDGILHPNGEYYIAASALFQTKGTMAYAFIFLILLLWSCLRWIKAPSLKTLLWTLFTGWGLFGVPGMFFFWWIGSMG